ncbi:hypothetical protein Plhal304r1_c038g0114411 [Plasmopara halstedii]
MCLPCPVRELGTILFGILISIQLCSGWTKPTAAAPSADNLMGKYDFLDRLALLERLRVLVMLNVSKRLARINVLRIRLSTARTIRKLAS